jgi:hypothetical protein
MGMYGSRGGLSLAVPVRGGSEEKGPVRAPLQSGTAVDSGHLADSKPRDNEDPHSSTEHNGSTEG